MTKYLISLYLSLFIILPLQAATSSQTICLNMIVKNEQAIITRCLQSVLPLIDYWVIVDTGSTDNTKELIRTCMKDIPGELHERPWVDFAHNRNQALNLAKGKADYILFIDADEVLRFEPDFVKPDLDKDFYYIFSEYHGMKYARVGLVKDTLNWTWKGVRHEAIDCPQAKTLGTLAGVTNVVNTDGARSKDPQKFQKDAIALEAAIEKEPQNARYVFYLAQSYRDAEDYERALKNYEKRVSMEGWEQEVFWSLLQIAMIQELLEKPSESITNSYYKAYLYRPMRAESLFRLSSYFRKKGDYFSGYLTARQGLTIPLSDDALFVEKWIYDYGLLLEYSICAYWLGKYQDAQLASYLLLAKNIPDNVRDCVKQNLTFIDAKLAPKCVFVGSGKEIEVKREVERKE